MRSNRPRLTLSNPSASCSASNLSGLYRCRTCISSFLVLFEFAHSYNENKNQFNEDGEGHQRFLNVRFRASRDECSKCLSELKAAIEEMTTFTVLKVISEYVWFDTLTALDNGWIDYSPEELAVMFRA